MFLCEECHKKDCDLVHFIQSHGACESCGKVTNCVECKIHHHPELHEQIKERMKK